MPPYIWFGARGTARSKLGGFVSYGCRVQIHVLEKTVPSLRAFRSKKESGLVGSQKLKSRGAQDLWEYALDAALALYDNNDFKAAPQVVLALIDPGVRPPTAPRAREHVGIREHFCVRCRREREEGASRTFPRKLFSGGTRLTPVARGCVRSAHGNCQAAKLSDQLARLLLSLSDEDLWWFGRAFCCSGAGPSDFCAIVRASLDLA